MGSTVSEAVSLTFAEDCSLATITLGREDETAIVLTPTRMDSLLAALEEVRTKQPQGLVLRAPSLKSFCVGADISLIQGVTDPREGFELAQQGQEAYNLLEDLNCTTVAAISGPCVGGGCELVLACDYRILSDGSSSVIGLPETKLGILPGFGGTYRLPRLIGLPAALDIILAGKTVKAKKALKIGLVDKLSRSELLFDEAAAVALGHTILPKRKKGLGNRLASSTRLGRFCTAHMAQKSLQRQTKGFYPAPEKALVRCVKGLGLDRSTGLALEAQDLGKLIVTPESKALVHVYYLTEHSKTLAKTANLDPNTLHGMVIGAGTMGAGIAGLLAQKCQSVIVKDTSLESLNRGKKHTQKTFSKRRSLSSFQKAAALNRIDWLQYHSETERRAGMVIEAVFENMSLKKTIFQEVAQHVDTDCILASNTSSLSVTELASELPRPERFIGMHFFNPVERMPLIELITGDHTSEETVAKTAALSLSLGKFPIVVKDVPGFLVNRILIPYLNEAVYLLQEGYSVVDIDTAATQFGMPMGPIRLLDEVGLDVAAHVSEIMVQGYGERMSVPAFAKTLTERGRLGKKNKKGFYDYSSKKAVPWSELTDILGISATKSSTSDSSYLQQRLIFHLVNEAMKCLNEGVAGTDLEHATKQIDLGMVMGIGFPPFRGGVIHYAQQVGLDVIRDHLQNFADEFGIRYVPWKISDASVSNGD